MTKKDKILQLFNSREFERGVKTFTYDDFLGAGLSPRVEDDEKYCDIIYARRIIKKLGHRVGIGMAFHVWEK